LFLIFAKEEIKLKDNVLFKFEKRENKI